MAEDRQLTKEAYDRTATSECWWFTPYDKDDPSLKVTGTVRIHHFARIGGMIATALCGFLLRRGDRHRENPPLCPNWWDDSHGVMRVSSASR